MVFAAKLSNVGDSYLVPFSRVAREQVIDHYIGTQEGKRATDSSKLIRSPHSTLEPRARRRPEHRQYGCILKYVQGIPNSEKGINKIVGDLLVFGATIDVIILILLIIS